MVVGDQYDEGRGIKFLSLSFKCFVSLIHVFYSETMHFDFVVKQCVLFNNPQHFCLSISLQCLIWLVITIVRTYVIQC